MLFRFIYDIRMILVFSFLLSTAFTPNIAAEKHIFEAEFAELVDGAAKVVDSAASGGLSVRLTAIGEGVRFHGLPAAAKLAIRYASLGVGVIGVSVNNQPAQKVNVHSSGSLAGSFLHAAIAIAIPADAVVAITLVTNDITVSIDQIIVGDGDLGLPPDIWNLPPLPVAAGPYPADWRGLSRRYTVPEWWR
ncbi:MAG: hypothetical protein WB699_06895, partial [Bacteroidota bacterium]